MSEQQVIHSTFVLQRTLYAKVEKVFSAFASPEQKRRWFGGSPSTDLEEFTMDFRPGGSEQMVYRFKETSLFPGVELTNVGVYQDIVPNGRIIQAQRMAMAGKIISTSLITFEFLPAEEGTEVVLTNQSAFLEGSDGPERRELGWKTLLDSLQAELSQ